MNDTPSTAGIILTNYCGQDLFDLYLSKEWYTKSGNNKRRHKMILMSKFLIAKYHFTFIGETFDRLKQLDTKPLRYTRIFFKPRTRTLFNFSSVMLLFSV